MFYTQHALSSRNYRSQYLIYIYWKKSLIHKTRVALGRWLQHIHKKEKKETASFDIEGIGVLIS